MGGFIGRGFEFEHPPVHDVCCTAYCTKPSVVKEEKLRGNVETSVR